MISPAAYKHSWDVTCYFAIDLQSMVHTRGTRGNTGVTDFFNAD
jgi:hypothetical protein